MTAAIDALHARGLLTDTERAGALAAAAQTGYAPPPDALMQALAWCLLRGITTSAALDQILGARP